MFADWRAFIFENDSVDDTKNVLKAHSCDKIAVVTTDNGRPHLNYTKSQDRTIALAEYRNTCRLWCAENCWDFDYAIVFDTDPWGGWSVDGIANTVGHLEDDEYSNASGMGSYSWAIWVVPYGPSPRNASTTPGRAVGHGGKSGRTCSGSTSGTRPSARRPSA